MSKIAGPTVVIGIPSFGMVSTHFYQARVAQQFPLVSSTIDKVVLNKPIADARNEIVEYALSQGSSYIYWLDDDVIAPPDAFLKMYTHHKDIINGVYWSKSNPPMPLLFRGLLKGPYWNWHVGDLIEIDAAGSGLTLVKTDVYRKISKDIGGPWYSVDYSSFPGYKGPTPANNTEDLYFYWKAKKAGYQVWADTSIQALHYEKNSGVMYHMPSNAPQAKPAWEVKVNKERKLIADLGSGGLTPYALDEGDVVTFDIREEIQPDVVCDLRRIPCPPETFDKVFSSHVLEHFPYMTVDAVLKEWTKILKVGGELHIVVPNLRFAAKRIAEDAILPQDLWILYGEQNYAKNFHTAGFTPKTLFALVEQSGDYENIQVSEGDMDGVVSAENWNLELRATKKISTRTYDNISPDEYEAPPPDPNPQGVLVPIFNEYRVREYEGVEDEVSAIINAGIDRKNTVAAQIKEYALNDINRAIFNPENPPKVMKCLEEIK